MRPCSVALVLAFGCSTSHPADPSDDGGARVDAPSGGDRTELTIWSRLPGATITIEGVSAVLDASEVALTVRPAIRATTTTLHVEGGGATLDLPADWSRDYEVLHLPSDTALDAMTFRLARLDDGSCGYGSTNGRAGEWVWAGDSAYPTTACGPFGLVRFRRDSSSGPCPPGADCGGFEEITGDGTLRIDRIGAPGAPIVETTLTSEDLLRVRLALTEPALMDLLAGERPCPEVTDIFETMRLEWRLESAENETPWCDAPELVAVRELLDELTARYAP